MGAIRTVAVIGAGAAGRSIALGAARAGFRTILEDILPASLRRAEGEFRNNLRMEVVAGNLSHGDAHAVLSRLEYASSVEEAARQADLVIEAVPDEWESKSEIFILLDKICRPETILATTTSTLDVSEIASVTYRPGKVVGMSFGTGVEIVRGAATSEETLADCTAFLTAVGRQAGDEARSVSADINRSLRSG